ncbi:unnamed protein product [Rotaria socialis]|uniref:Uncharacterized protein n=1 Tax=Rotaria socialis TaxID=392032 RepID=A0A820TYB0_9BILA|nr:unnamed protein product [Rotaria socialis]CAF4474052.1 unnamed protein product [Rotaria socialis]CAF4644941.1 unnamed protein product [Rotaria socialis]
MSTGFNIFLLFICIFLRIRTNQGFHHDHRSQNFRKYRHIPIHDATHLNASLASSTIIEPIQFFQNEPVPLAASVVDDLTTLASAIYIICLIVLILIILAWITHYNAPCSSVITSILSTITGLPEPIIHSVALCGSCCLWCERTWLFRRIHQFNIWISSKIQQFISGTCKVLYDTICPCCRPPDTPSNRSIIGSLPASMIAKISVPDTSKPSPSKTIVTVLEPTSLSPRRLTLNVGLYSQPKAESLIENQDYLSSEVTNVETKTNTNQTYENRSTNKKRRRYPRRKTQLKQRTAIDESPIIDEQLVHTSEDDESDEEEEVEDENTKIY